MTITGEQRKDRRFSVAFHSSFATVNRVEGAGTMVDLSVRGCRITSPSPVQPGTELRLDVRVGDERGALQITKAVVRWERGGHFGVEFLDMADADWTRLCGIIKALEQKPQGHARGGGHG